MSRPYPFLDSLQRRLSPDLAAALADRFGERFARAIAVREHHGRDESPLAAAPPEAVVFAQTTDEVTDIVRLCAAHRYPIIPFGAGSSLEGHLLAVQGGLSVDLSQMNAVLAIQPEDLTATVQAGVTRKQLNTELAHTGLFFPVDPGADASIGGMAATRASGTNAVRYGTMRENVVCLTVVTADGKVIRTARPTKKSAAGYDLTRLFVGSEGTLGVITEITVRLYPQPEAVSAAVVSFPNTGAAVNTVIQTIQMGLPLARSEFLCEHTIRAINAYSKSTLKEQPTLFFEFHGSESSVNAQARIAQEIAHELGGEDFEWASLPEERNRLWSARHNAFFACLQARPGSRAITTDTCVPISRLVESLLGARRILEQWPHPSMILGHVGDGNFHAVILLDPDSEKEREAGEKLNEEIVRLALSMEGTCTGEHGVGLHKMDFLVDEYGEDAIELMRRIKLAFDPGNILNPGKILRVWK